METPEEVVQLVEPVSNDLSDTIISFDAQLREAIKAVMDSEEAEQKAVAKVQELVDRRAASIRESFSAKVARVKTAM